MARSAATHSPRSVSIATGIGCSGLSITSARESSPSKKTAARPLSISATRRPLSTRRPSKRLNILVSREGVKTKDFTAITQVGATIKVTLDEITGENLAMFALGEIDTTTPGAAVISGLSKAEFKGDIKVTGTNDIGQQVDFEATDFVCPVR